MGASRGSSASVKSSRKSSKRGTYKVISQRSEVDESLFASSQKKQDENSPVGKEGTQVAKGGGKAPISPGQPLVLTRSAIAQMRVPAEVVIAEANNTRPKPEGGEPSPSGRSRNRAAIAAMVKAEEERQKKAAQASPDSEKDAARRAAAGLKLIEELDEVKRMNQMILYSKCMTERDQQVQEKKAREEEERERQRALDLAMEVDRIRALEAYEERERHRATERQRGAQILAEQLAARQMEKTRLEERLTQESEAMQREVERLKAADVAAAEAKKKVAKQLMEEVAASNAVLQQRRVEAAAAEAADNARIAAYLAQRDVREQAAMEERARIAHNKEMEVARLRARQEKFADRRSEIDELRARRYQEQHDREWRAKEAAKVAQGAAVNAELAAAREAQQAATLAARAEVARQEEQDFRRILLEAAKAESSLAQQDVASQEAAKRYAGEVRVQICANEERRRREREERLQEGARVAAQLLQHRGTVEAIRQRKLSELEKEGVPQKYCAELARKKFTT